MMVSFAKLSPPEALSLLRKQLEHREMGRLLSMELSPGGDLQVKIQKMGTSHLCFSCVSHFSGGAGFTWELTSEKLAFSHRVFRGEVLAKLTKLLQGLGGEVHS